MKYVIAKPWHAEGSVWGHEQGPLGKGTSNSSPVSLEVTAAVQATFFGDRGLGVSFLKADVCLQLSVLLPPWQVGLYHLVTQMVR